MIGKLSSGAPSSAGVVFASLVALGLGLACGGGSPEERAVKASLEAFLGAIGKDGEKACLQLSREAQAALMRSQDAATCERAAETIVPADNLVLDPDFDAIRFGPGSKWARVPTFPGVLVEELKIELDSELRSMLEDLYPEIPLGQGDGRWRITSLDWYFEL